MICEEVVAIRLMSVDSVAADEQCDDEEHHEVNHPGGGDDEAKPFLVCDRHVI
jgi:hypothetical protein